MSAMKKVMQIKTRTCLNKKQRLVGGTLSRLVKSKPTRTAMKCSKERDTQRDKHTDRQKVSLFRQERHEEQNRSDPNNGHLNNGHV